MATPDEDFDAAAQAFHDAYQSILDTARAVLDTHAALKTMNNELVKAKTMNDELIAAHDAALAELAQTKSDLDAFKVRMTEYFKENTAPAVEILAAANAIAA